MVAVLLEELDGAEEIPGGPVDVPMGAGGVARRREEPRLVVRIVGEVGGSGERGRGLAVRTERGGALARPPERVADRLAKLSCFLGVGLELERGEVVRGHDLDDLLLAARPRGLEERSCGEMPGLAIALRERLVGDASNEVLEKAVLPAFGRARVGLEEEDLLAHEAPRSGSRSSFAAAGDRGERFDDERLAEDRGVLDELALRGLEAVDAEATSACSVSGTASVSISPTTRYEPFACSSCPRFISIRTVSTA